ncbi:hypothetical protein [Phormidium sp. CCY1219]|uniref:hypothetical protein n=1 Tax=Phormidium sp. CCY1219 TaxID=2886104 RepID=UPI002D1E817F|nr:hypothetical protein [Phormidium sp. CCY1219]MEB3829735.1 hypothetical protein [Phormidium sp. CCY1219]
MNRYPRRDRLRFYNRSILPDKATAIARLSGFLFSGQPLANPTIVGGGRLPFMFD